MNKEEIKIITLGDIFRNFETEEQAFEFLKYIKNLQHEKEDYKSRVENAVEIIDLMKPELWNISNKMTYKLIDIKNILQNGSDASVKD